MPKNQNKVPDFLKIAEEIKRKALSVASAKGIAFFKDSFRKGGFTNTSFEKWKASTNPISRRTMLNTYNLMRSIYEASRSETRLVIGTDSDYAQIHNEGGTITVTPQMKKYFWAMYYKFGKKSVKADYFKKLALMKVGSRIKIPQRQFIGESHALMAQLDEWLLTEIEIQFKQ